MLSQAVEAGIASCVCACQCVCVCGMQVSEVHMHHQNVHTPTHKPHIPNQLLRQSLQVVCMCVCMQVSGNSGEGTAAEKARLPVLQYLGHVHKSLHGLQLASKEYANVAGSTSHPHPQTTHTQLHTFTWHPDPTRVAHSLPFFATSHSLPFSWRAASSSAPGQPGLLLLIGHDVVSGC